MKNLLLACVGMVLAAMAGCDQSGSSESGGGGAATKRIAVIPKGTTHVFWKSVEAGAQAKAKEAGVEVIWKGPLKENDRASQIELVQQFVSQGVDGIVLAPLDNRALLGPVRAATESGIPVVIIDSGLAGEVGKDFISFVATDNYQGGVLAAQAMIKALPAGGDIVVLRYQAGSASTQKREDGFIDTIKAAGNFNIISDNQYGGPTAGDAQQKATNMADLLQQADGIYAPNESTTFGMLLALRQFSLQTTKTFIGFDSSPPLVAALKAGEINALVVQNPHGMGYKSVAVMLDHLDGKAIDGRVDTGVVVLTKDNINDPEIKKLIQ